jgi:toxin ParE1/3/4
MKPVIPRTLARQDVDHAVDYYLRESGTDVALRFIDALEQAYVHIRRHPAMASLRYAHALNLPGLRNCQLRRFPYFVFYIERADCIDVWRVLHEKRDIPSRFHEDG